MTVGWNCACSSEIGICIINYAGRQAAHKKNPAKIHFHNHVLKLNIIFQLKENSKTNFQTQ